MLWGANTKSRDHNVLSLERSCQFVHVVRVALEDFQVRMLALDLLRRAYEGRYFMPSGEPKIDDFGSGMAIGTNDKYFHDSCLLPD